MDEIPLVDIEAPPSDLEKMKSVCQHYNRANVKLAGTSVDLIVGSIIVSTVVMTIAQLIIATQNNFEKMPVAVMCTLAFFLVISVAGMLIMASRTAKISRVVYRCEHSRLLNEAE